MEQEAANLIPDDNKIYENSKYESDPALKDSELEIITSMDAPQIPPRSPDRLVATPERSPDRLVATRTHDESIASLEELIFDNESEVSAGSEDLELESLPTIEPLSTSNKPSSDRGGVYNEFNEHKAASDVHAVIPELFLSEDEEIEETEETHDFISPKKKGIDEETAVGNADEEDEDAEETEETHEFVASKARSVDEKAAVGNADKDDEAIQELPLLFVEDEIESDREDEVVATSQEKEYKESATKETPSESAFTTIADATEGDAKNSVAGNDKENDAESAEEQIPLHLPLMATEENTDDDLKRMFFSWEAEQEPVDHYNGEEPRTEGITIFTNDKGPITEDETLIANYEDTITKHEGPVTQDEETPTKKAKKDKKGKKGTKEAATTVEDESSTFADKGAHLFENIKEAI